jgi:hypothetical protein
MQRQEELAARELVREPVRGVNRQGGLADPGHPVDRVNAHHPAVSGQAVNRPGQPGMFGLAAGERGQIPRQAPGRRRREHPRRALPGR